MNAITYEIHDETEHGGFITFSATVEDGRSCGAFETFRTFSFAGDCQVEKYLAEFIFHLGSRQYHLHINEHEGAS